MADIDQGAVDAAIDPYASQISARSKRRDEFARQAVELGKQEVAGSETLASDIEERGKATEPVRERITEKISHRPGYRTNEEQIPNYLRPKGDAKEMERAMSALSVAAMLVGVATRQPFYGAAQAMTGFMKGYMDADEKLVKESMLAYDRNLNAIKERNASKRRAVEAAIKNYENDLLGMQQQLKIISAQYDDPILAQRVRVGSITDQRQIALEQLKAEGNAIDHLIQASESMKLRHAILAERLAKRTAGAAPTGKDTLTAQQILKSYPWYDKIKDNDTTISLSAEVASRAKSLVVSGNATDFADGVDMAVDDLTAEGLLKPGSKTPWYKPDVPTTFRRPAPETAAPSSPAAAASGNPDLGQQAREAIAAGKDPAAVKQRYKELTGEELPDGGV